MQTTRRDLLNTFATVGPLGAMSLGHAPGGRPPRRRAFLTSRYGKGPALEGPYLDLRTGKGNKLAYARIQGDLDTGSKSSSGSRATAPASGRARRSTTSVGLKASASIRLIPLPDGSIQRMCREIILYTDLRSGDVLEEWKNPYLDETVKVVHVDNDPFDYMIEDLLPGAAVLRWPQQGSAAARGCPSSCPGTSTAPGSRWRSTFTWLTRAPLQPDKWPRESAGPIAQVSEYLRAPRARPRTCRTRN